jgi:Uma2 family endonuclease
MNVALARPVSLVEFLEWEDRQPLRYEFDGSRPFAMTGGTRAHAGIQRNLAISIGGRLRGKPCQFYGSDLKIEAAGSIRYSDGFVVCTPVSPQDKVVREPVVIFEVMSDSSWRTDTITKNREYAATPSVQRYIILAQDEIGGQMFERVGDEWLGHVLAADAVLRMPEIGIEIPLVELYEDVEFPTIPPEDAAR